MPPRRRSSGLPRLRDSRGRFLSRSQAVQDQAPTTQNQNQQQAPQNQAPAALNQQQASQNQASTAQNQAQATINVQQAEHGGQTQQQDGQGQQFEPSMPQDPQQHDQQDQQHQQALPQTAENSQQQGQEDQQEQTEQQQQQGEPTNQTWANRDGSVSSSASSAPSMANLELSNAPPRSVVDEYMVWPILDEDDEIYLLMQSAEDLRNWTDDPRESPGLSRWLTRSLFRVLIQRGPPLAQAGETMQSLRAWNLMEALSGLPPNREIALGPATCRTIQRLLPALGAASINETKEAVVQAEIDKIQRYRPQRVMNAYNANCVCGEVFPWTSGRMEMGQPGVFEGLSLRCGHKICRECLATWLKTDDAAHNDCCPWCRATFLPANAVPASIYEEWRARSD